MDTKDRVVTVIGYLGIHHLIRVKTEITDNTQLNTEDFSIQLQHWGSWSLTLE